MSLFFPSVPCSAVARCSWCKVTTINSRSILPQWSLSRDPALHRRLRQGGHQRLEVGPVPIVCHEIAASRGPQADTGLASHPMRGRLRSHDGRLPPAQDPAVQIVLCGWHGEVRGEARSLPRGDAGENGRSRVQGVPPPSAVISGRASDALVHDWQGRLVRGI